MRGAFSSLIGKTNLETQSGEGYQKAANDKFQGMVAWNDQIAVIGMPGNREVDVEDRLTEFFNTTEETSLASNKDLQKAMSSNDDISNWITTDAIAKNPQAGFALSMIQVPATALEGNTIHSKVNFENGAIVGQSNAFFNKDLGVKFYW